MEDAGRSLPTPLGAVLHPPLPPPLGAVQYPPLPPFPHARDRRSGQLFVPRSKIQIRWVEDDARRRATLKKRRAGIVKKAEELSVLCNVQVCTVIFSPGEEDPIVYPSLEHAVSICQTYRQLPDFSRRQHMSSHPQFVQEMVKKKNKKVWSRHEEMKEKETMAHVYNGLAGADMKNLDAEAFDRVQKRIQKMIKDLRRICRVSQPTAQAAPPPPLPEQPGNLPGDGDGGDDSGFVDAIQQHVDENDLLKLRGSS